MSQGEQAARSRGRRGRARARGRATVAALVAVALATGLSGCEPAPGSDRPIESGPLSAATEAWWAYERPAEYGSVRTDLDVPARDGTLLDCSLVRPATGTTPVSGRFPGLVTEFTPYHLIRDSYEEQAGYFAERGYNALVCNVRGTGESGGDWDNAMSARDGRDAHDLVEWLAAQPFSDGRIGMLGESYGGQTTYGAAVEQAPHLKAIAPLQSPADLYDDVVYPGGAKTTENGTIDNWPPIAEVLSGGRIDAAAEYATNRAHPTFDQYWRERSFDGRYDSIEVPVLAVGGWEDGFFRSGTITNIEGALDRTWAIYGPWPHRNPFRFPGCVSCVDDGGLSPGILLAWFDHWVMELPGVPVPAEPTFVSYEGPIGVGAGWRELSHWNPGGVDALTLTLGTGGSLTESPGRPGTATFHQPADPAVAGGSVTFTSAPLGGDRVLVGRPLLGFRATLSGPDANVHAELLDVAPDGTVTVVNDGFLRASHRLSHTEPSPVTPGEPATFVVEVRPDHHRFVAGHSIAIRLSGGAADTLTPNDTPVDVTIDAGDDSSALVLPGITEL